MRKTVASKAFWRCGTAVAGVAGALLLAGMASRTANAEPSYGYAELEFTNFILSGVVDSSGKPVAGVSSVSDSVLVTDGANYPPASSGGHSANGDLVGGADALEATAGPGPFPGQNVFSQQLLASSGTRGDGKISGAIAGGATSNMVSEGNLTIAPGSAGSTAGSSTTITATFTVAATTTIGLSFNAADTLISQVGALGDSATALTTATFSILDMTTGKYVSICDLIGGTGCTTAGSNSALATEAPQALNQSVGTTTPGAAGADNTSSPLTAYDFDAVLASGKYRLELGDGTQDILSTALVPEPISLAVLGTGLLGIGVVRRRRRQH